MKFEWDNTKRESNIKKHNIDFVDAARLLLGNTYISQSTKSGNDKERMIAIGELDGRIYTIVYTLRNGIYRIISSRRASNAEKKKFWNIYSK